MKIKTKIRLGLIFLLAIIIALAFSGSYYINHLADVSNNILKDNYLTLTYTKNMIQALDEPDSIAGINELEQNLVKQENNITEIGEKDETQNLRSLFDVYKSGKHDELTESQMRQRILHIQQLNMDAIIVKNNRITATTKRVFAYISLLGGFSFLFSFTFVINFPGMIANPIAELTVGIKEIANRNYSSRLNFKSNDEFGEVAGAFNDMARRLDEYENSNVSQLMFEKKRIETIINNMKDPIIGLDENNRVLFANSIAIQLLGLYEKDLIGKYAPDVALRNDLLRNLLVKEEMEKLLKIYADNKESYFTKDSLEIINNGQKIGEVIMLRNITRYQEQDAAKTNFIATISHELKTPISSIKMSLKLLEDDRIGELNTEQKKLVENIKGDSQRLLKITTELLDLTQIESGKIQLNIEKVAPLRIVQQAMESAKALALQKNITIEKLMADDLPLIPTDADKTAWVLLNLLTNAIRFSPEKAVVKLSVEQKGDKIRFSVEDSGPGIEQKYYGRIFERFFQTPGLHNEGSGMGLAISKEIIEKLDGWIGLESEPGKGSKFMFDLKI